MAIKLFLFPWCLSTKDLIFAVSEATVISPVGKIDLLADSLPALRRGYCGREDRYTGTEAD
jgi:hypothetical protein